jgi:hypothetical protein
LLYLHEVDVQGLNSHAAELTEDLKEMRILGGPDDNILTSLHAETSDDHQCYDHLHMSMKHETYTLMEPHKQAHKDMKRRQNN